MLTLYHHGSSVCAAKVRLALYEKNLDFEAIYIDVLKGDQFAPAYLALNPRGVVPTLVHDGAVLVESTAICEYIDDAFDGPALRPENPVDRHGMRLWTMALDEDIHHACAGLTFAACHRHIINRLSHEDREAFLNATPDQSVMPNWRERKRQICDVGFEAPDAVNAVRIYDGMLDRMEQQLASSAWLAGDHYSLADIGITPYVNRLAMLSMDRLWTESRPHVTRWFDAIRARPGFQTVVLDWCPPQLTTDLRTFGALSWPDLVAVLGRAA